MVYVLGVRHARIFRSRDVDILTGSLLGAPCLSTRSHKYRLVRPYRRVPVRDVVHLAL